MTNIVYLSDYFPPCAETMENTLADDLRMIATHIRAHASDTNIPLRLRAIAYELERAADMVHTAPMN